MNDGNNINTKIYEIKNDLLSIPTRKFAVTWSQWEIALHYGYIGAVCIKIVKLLTISWYYQHNIEPKLTT